MKKYPLLRQLSIRLLLLLPLVLASMATSALQAADQVLGGDEVENALRITCEDDGMRVEAFIRNYWSVDGYQELTWRNQVYDNDKSCMIHYQNGGEFKYTAGYYDGLSMSCTLNTNISSTVNRRVWTGGSVVLTMDTMYESPSRNVSYAFSISNKSASVLTHVEFYHGQDTYLGGSDSGGGYWSSADKAVGVKKPDPKNRADEIYQQMAATNPVADRYCSLGYYDVKLFVEYGNLGNILNTNYYIDNGYALQWGEYNNPMTLNPGEVFTVDVSELFKVGGDLVLTMPSTADIGLSTVVTGEVLNAGDTTRSVFLSSAVDNTNWTALINGPTNYTLAPGMISNVLIDVTCPAVVSVGVQADVTLSLTNNDESTSAKTTMTGIYYDGVALVEGVTDDGDPSITERTDFGGHPVSSYVTNIFEVYNGGPLSVTITNVTMTGSGAAQFTETFDATTLSAGAITNLVIVYQNSALASDTATLTLYDDKPWNPFVMNMAGYTWTISTNSGPKRGGNEVTLTSGLLGSGADINQVMVGGMNAEVLDQGTNWVSFVVPEQPETGLVDIYINSISEGSKTMKDCYYVNPIGTLSYVSPETGYYTGGTVVTITGTNFCNGSMDDITNVTFQGIPVTSIDSVAGSTQVVVTVAPALPGRATIVIESFTHGRCEFRNAFSFEGPDMFVYGKTPYSYMPSNEITNNAAPSSIKGSAYGYTSVGGEGEQVFYIVNSNAAPLHILSITTNGADPDSFEVVSLSTTNIGQNEEARLHVKFSPTSSGSKTATVIIDSDAPDAPFLLNLSCEGVDMAPVQGPIAGGDSVTISNFELPGTVTALKVGGQDATIEYQADNVIRFTTPTGLWHGNKDVTLYGADFSNTIVDAYSYNERGRIFGAPTDDWSQWEILPDIPHGITPNSNMWFMGIVEHEGYVMAIGGTHTGLCKEATFYYDGFEWFDGPELPFGWAGFALASQDDTLHLVGGYTQTMHHGVSSRCLGSNYLNASWTFMGQDFVSNAPLNNYQYDQPAYMGGATVAGRVYTLGGCYGRYSSGLDIYRTTNFYTLSGRKTWVRGGGFPGFASSSYGIYHGRTAMLSNKLYSIGGYGWTGEFDAMTNAYVFDGTNTTTIAGLPYELGRLAVGTASGQVYAAGGSQYYFNSYYFSNRVYKLDGSGWSEVAALRLPANGGQFYGGASLDDRFYAIGPTSYAYPNRTYANGVSPTGCVAAGGVTVTISGRNLCDGTMADVTRVVLAGTEVASIDSVSSTQIVVTAAAGSGAIGDVVVTSAKYGETVAENAFTYSGIGIQVMDANGDLVVADQAASTSAGTDYGIIPQDSPVTNWLTIENTGDGVVNFSGMTTNGSSVFQVGSDFILPATLAQGATTNVPIICDTSVLGDHSAVLNFNNDTAGASSNYPVNLAAMVYNLSTNTGAFQGGTTLTITSGLIGNGTDITGVDFHTYAATIVAQGSNWVTVTTPPSDWAMICDIIISSDSLEDTVLENAYTYREAAWIGGINYSDGEWKSMNGPAGNVQDMVMGPDGYLYVCGWFTNLVDGTRVPSRVAKYEYGVWSPVGTNELNSVVRAIEFAGTDLYAGGGFQTIDGVYDHAFVYKAKFDGTNWVTAFTNRLDDDVYALDYDGTNLYLGGEFDYYGYTNVAVWDGSTLANIGNGITNYVEDLIYHNGYLYAGTDGSSVGEFARYTGSAWQHLTTYMDDGVYALAASGNDIYFGGYFTYVNAGEMAYVGQYDGSISGMANGLSNRVTAMTTMSNGDVIAGYYQYWYVDGIPTVDNMAAWNGTSWVPCGDETAYGGTVYSLLAVYNGIYVGGDFYNVGNGISNCAFFAFGQTNTISPKTGSSGGGTSVTIPGYNLGNGTMADVYRITICGEDVASIDSVSSTQIMVTTAAGPGGPGDVVVYTHDYGIIEMANAFTYDSGSGLKLQGMDSSLVANGAVADVRAGTFGWAHPGETQTNQLTIDNPGDQALVISAVQTNGTDAALFDVELPSRIEAGATSNIFIRFSPVAAGDFSASATIENNTQGSSSNFIINLALGGYTSTADEGPWDGEGLMTISNGTLGSGSDISSVRIGNYTATIEDQGTDWIQFRMPIAASSSVEHIYITSDSLGETIIPNGYEYHKGSLWGYTNDWGHWEDMPRLPASVYYASAAVYDGKIYAHGNTTNVYTYTYGASSWEAAPGLPLVQIDSYYYSNRTLIVYGTNLMAVGGNIKYSNRLTNDCNYRFTGTEWVQAGDFPLNHYVYWGNAGVKDDTLYYFGSAYNTLSNMVSTTNANSDWEYVMSGYPHLMHSQGAVTLSNRLFSLGGLRSTTVYSNIYEFNGTSWETNTIPGLPIKMHSMGATVMDGDIYVMGGFDYGNYSYINDITNAYRYKDGVWEGLPGIKYAKGGPGACTYHEQVYCIGGTYRSWEVYAYPKHIVNGGVLPVSGANTGGYQAVLSGFELFDGTTGDIERVTFGGADATVLSVAGSTQITVQVAGGPFGPVDVKVYSTLCGITTSSNAFTFTGKDITVLGTNGAEIASGEAASRAKGSDFGTVQYDMPVSRTFVITNAGTEATSISGIGFGGTAATQLVTDASAFPISLAANSSTNLTVTWTPDGSGMLDASMIVSNNTVGPQANYVVNLSASVITLDRATYSEDGGGILTISNGIPLGNGHDITTVLFGTEELTPVAQGSNWVQIVIPPGSIGTVSPIVIQSFTVGDTTLIDAFSYVAAGSIYGNTPTWTEMPGLPTDVTAHAAFVLNDSLYSVGGTTESGDSTNMYRFDGIQWHEVAGLPGGARAYGGGAVYSNAFYYIGGSMDLFTVYTNMYRFDGTNWSEVAGLPEPMQMMAAGVAEGEIVVAGGIGNIGQSMTNSYAFDGSQWTEIPGLRSARALQGSAVRNGTLYSLGGKTGGGNATFNVYRSDGSGWASDAGLPALIYSTAGADYHERVLAIGGADDNNVTNGVWRFDGTSWSSFATMPSGRMGASAAYWRGAVYVLGGEESLGVEQTNVWMLTDGGVSPIEGYPAGGYNVTICGTNLCSGEINDVNYVTVCGVTASVLNVYGSTQIVVTVGTGESGTGDVVVNSVLYGEITAENAFTYKRGVITLIGTNDVDIAQDDPASAANGTDFGSMLVGESVTNVFGIRNTGNDAITLSAVDGGGQGGASFTVTDFPTNELTIGATGQITVVCASLGGDQPATLAFRDNVELDPSLPEIIGYTSSIYNVTSYGSGPGLALSEESLTFSGTIAGTNPATQTFDVSDVGTDPLTFTNSVSYATPGDNWLTVLPTGSVSLAASGTTTVTNYVNISNLNAGVHVATVQILSPTATNSPISCVVTLTIAKTTQTLTWNNPGQQTYTNETVLDATASSGLTPTYTVVSGPATISSSGWPVVATYTDTGEVTIVASEDGNMNYYPATPATQSWTVVRARGQIVLTDLVQEYTGSEITADVVTSPTGLPYDITYDGLPSGPTNVGSYEVIATLTDPLIYGGTTGTLEITRISQTIIFPAIPAQKTNSTVGLAATGGGSGNPVTFAVISGPGSLVNSTNLSFTGIGDVLITADQAGGGNYNAAATVTNLVRVFTVTPDIGPYTGDNMITISNGNLGTVTNAQVGTIDVIGIVDSGVNWVNIVMPAATNQGLTDITLQTIEFGDIVLPEAYTYNPPGSLYGSVLDWSIWQQVNGLNEGRRQLDAAALNGKLYAISGYGGSGYTTNVNVFDGTNWTDVAGLPEARGALSACEYSNHIYAIGGYNPGGKTNVYQFNGSAWTEVTGLPTGLFGVAACSYSGKLYSVGGYGDDIVTNVFAYDGANWTEVAGLPAERSYMNVGVVNGQLIAAGGADNTSTRTNVYAFDGTSWTEVSGMPLDLGRAVYGVVTGQLYVAGGLSTLGTVTNTYRFDGTTWTAAPGMAVRIRDAGSAVLDGALYGVAGRNQSYVIQTNVYRYPTTIPYGAAPSLGSWTGGYEVVVDGKNLGNGADITNVTLCGVVATINSQTATRVWITAGTATASQIGDLVVQSVNYGTTIKSNGFTYIAPTLSVLGTNGVAIASDEAANLVKGSKFFATKTDASRSYTFAITNTGNDVLNINGWTTNGADASLFSVVDAPALIGIGEVSNLSVRYAPVAVGIHTSQVSFTSDDPTSPFLFNLSGSCFAGSTNVGPYAGGNTLTITNGYFGTITNILVDGQSVTPSAHGDNWFTITLPAASSAGAVDFVVQTSDNGSTLLSDAYTYNYPGTLLDPLPALVSLTNTWLNGTNGTTFIGADDSGFMGCSVSPAGDVNDDGFTDMLIGAEWADNRVSHAYVVYGKSGLYPVDIVLTNTWLDGINGMWMWGLPFQGYFGNAVSDAGDMNGDGVDDMVVGAFQYDANGQWHAGEAFVVYGTSGLPSFIAANDSYMGTATNATKLGGSHRAGEAGTAVSSAGDVNGDGLTDLLVSAPEANPAGLEWAGETYLVYGSTNVLPNQVVLTNTWLDGVNGVIFAGAVTNDEVGEAVSSAGDVNGDGLDDMLIGARYAAPDGRAAAGEVYLVYGSTNLAANITLTNTWFDGTNGVLFAGAVSGDWCGRALSAAGDVNGDGLDDFLISANGVDTYGGTGTNAGAAYLVYGTTNGLPGSVILTNTWLDGVNGVMLLGNTTNDYCGASVSAGDVNGDGLNDLLIGAGFADPDGLNGGGETYLVYGKSDLPAQITLNDTWLDGTNGVILAGREFQCFAGNAVSAAGDYNNDSFDDILIGAEQADPEGETYLVYGSPFPVVPSTGSWTGGYPIVISGKNIGNSDVTNVTLCGLSATIVSQALNRVWVTAAVAPAPVLGDVVVQSISYGETIRSNGFTYASGEQVVLGTNGAVLASGEATSLITGNAFYPTPMGTTLMHTFSITNTGNDIIRIAPANLSNPIDFLLSNMPTAVDIGAISNFTVTYAPATIGDHTALLTFTNNTPTPVFTLNLAGSCYTATTNNGPYAGGNTITITNGSLGNGADITNVLVGGEAATITGQGSDWITIILPGATAPGSVYVLVQSLSEGDTILRDAYTYNPAGEIAGSTNKDWSVWDEVAGLPASRSRMVAAELGGSIYAIAGWQPGWSAQTNVYKFNGELWTEVAGLPEVRTPAGTAFDGKIYAMGGAIGSVYTNVYAFDGSAWTEVAGLPVARTYGMAGVFDGTMYFAGGQTNNTQASTCTNVFAFDGSSWSEGVGLPKTLNSAAAGTLSSGWVLTGGIDTNQGINPQRTNTFIFDGSSWAETEPLPYPLGLAHSGAAVLDDALYTMGGWGRQGVAMAAHTNVYRFDGTNWMAIAGLPDPLYFNAGVALDGFIYSIGGYNAVSMKTNVYRYPAMTVRPAVSPSSCSWTGGFAIVISGENLCNGSDITNVTLCGIQVLSIDSQSATQVMVTASVATGPTAGDVRVYSISYGETVGSNAFTYISGEQTVLGTNGATIASGETTSLARGNRFYPTLFGSALTNTFSITNSGNDTLSIDPSDLSDPTDFSMAGIPATVDIGAVSNFTVTYTPTTIGDHSVFVVFTNNTPDSPFTLYLAGSCFTASTNFGPYAGGNMVTITNGSFGTITNILVGGTAVTPSASGANWFTIVMPGLGATGTVDLIVQTSDNGDTLLANAYTYNPAGGIGQYGPVEYRVYSGFSFPQGYYTNTSPDGTYLWNYYRNGWMELRSTNGLAGGAWMRLNGWNGGFGGGGWDTSLGGYDWIGSNTALYVLDCYSFSHTNYIEVTNLVGESYQVDVVSSFQDDEYTQTMTMVSGVYQPGDPADNGDYGNWPSGGNTNAGLNLRPYYIYQTRTNYVTWTNAQTADKALSVVFTKQETEGNLFNNMRIKGLGIIGSGVDPSSGSWTGGYPVVITGSNLCNGSDATNVTLCGIPVISIDSQSATQITVTASAASGPLSGDVRVYSISFGETIRSNAFTYTSGQQVVLGTNGASIASGEAASLVKGGEFYPTPFGSALTNTFSITNSGNDVLAISAYDLSDPTDFSVSPIPANIDVGGVASLIVTYSPTTIGDHTAFVTFTNNTPTATFTLNLAGSCYAMSTNNGPYVGGNSITITNGTLGDGADITNVLVGGVAASITGQGTDWITVTLPLAGSAGVKDILIQSTSVGDTILRNAYTYNPAGIIATVLPASCFWTGNCPVVISGTDLCNGGADDITSITLAGVTATVDSVNGSTQILVTAVMSPAASGDVVVNAISHGVTVSSNAFTYYEPVMTARGTNGAAIASGDAASAANGTEFGSLIVNMGALTNTFSITNSGNTTLNISGVTTSGTGSAAFELVSWPSSVAVGAEETFTVIFTAISGGTFDAAMNFANDSTNSPYVVNLRGFGLGGGIALETNELNYTAEYADSNPIDQNIGMDNVGISAFTYTNTQSYSAGAGDWLSLTPAAGTVGIGGSTTLTNAVDITGINAGNYTCNLQIVAADATNSPQSVRVTLVVTPVTQTISFAQMPDMIITDTWGLSATGGASTNPITFAVLSGPASIAGGTNLSFDNVGEVRITADQAGDINYIPAPTLTNVFMISPTRPVISTPTVSNILSQTATLGGTIDSTNGTPVTGRGVLWQVEGDTNVYSAFEFGPFGTGAFSMNATGIIAGVTNSYQAMAMNVSGMVYTVWDSFLALPDAPEVTGPTNIQATSFYANWNAAVGATNYYLDVSETNSFDTYVPGYENLLMDTGLSVNVTGLGSVVWYYYRVRAENAAGLSTNSATRTVGLMMDLVIAGNPVEHDTPAPLDYGTHRIIVETMVTNSVTTPADETNGTRYACTGWTGTGDVPTNGMTNSVTFLFTTDSTLTWQWKTQYLLTQESTGGYVYGLVSGWQDDGWIFDLTARASNGYLFAHWLTNGSYAGDADIFRVLADAPKQISAIFAPTAWDVNVTGTTDRIDWEIIGANAFGTFEVCNPSDSGTRYLDKFLFAITPNANMHIRYPDGTSPTGQEYVDVTADVEAKLAFVGNGDAIMDPGECVTLDPIEFLGKNPAFLDTPRFYSKGLPDMSGIDTDGDGIPNTWEDQEGLNPNNPLDGGEDQDDDGVLSDHEYIADTNPYDPASYLHISDIDNTPGMQQIEWIGGSSVVQYLEWNPAMGSDVWSVISTNYPPTPITNLFDDMYQDVEGYYRIRAVR